ncbi:MAG: MFS transporter, partial [Bryobacterales bacterium]|nr:MFS transporter [Bryobacterales bacterium]
AVIDRVGRRPLLLWGALGCGLSLAGASWIIGSGQHAGWLVGFFGLFVICHAFGQGAVIWVFISEIFPTAVRGKGQTLGSFVHWFMAMLISWLFPLFAKEAGQPGAGLPFAFFAGAMVVQIVVIAKYFPETKQIALEDMSAALR